MNVKAREDTNPSIIWHMYGLYGKPSTAKKYDGQPIKPCKYPDTSKSTDTYKNIRQKVNTSTENYNSFICFIKSSGCSSVW